MEPTTGRAAAQKTRSFWRKKVVLLNYLEAFHLASDIDSLIRSLRILLQDEFNAAGVHFSVIDVRKKQLTYFYPEALGGVPVVTGEGFSGLAVAAGRALCFRSSEGPLPYHSLPETREFVRPKLSVLAAPLIRDGRIIGTIELIDRGDGKEFSAADVNYLEALAPHMAVALNHFVLAQEAKRREEEEARLKEIARSISASLNLNEMLEEIVLHLRGLIPYDAAAIVLFPLGGRREEAATCGLDAQERLQVIEEARRTENSWQDNGALARLLSRQDYEEFHLPARPTGESEIIIPLTSGEKTIGMFLLINDQRDAYSQADLELLEAFAGQASLAIERARLHRSVVEKTQLEQELRIARDIQLRFLPREMPVISRVQLAGRNVASRLVSGDYYDFIRIVDGQWGMVIGDVSSKGISAGLIMSAFRASLLAEIRNNFSIATILAKVNRLLWETTDQNRFVTAFYGVFDEKERVLTYSNAGHNPPLLLRSDGSFQRLETGGLILGAFESVRYVEARVNLWPGDLLLLYTDGVTEAPGPDGEELGTARVEQILRECYHRTPDEIADHLVAETTRYSEAALPEDDATLVVVKVV